MRRQKRDLFWCIEPSFAAGAAYLHNLLRFWDPTPVVLTQQSGQSETRIRKGRAGIINVSWRAALKRTDCVTVISTYLADLTRRFGYEGKIEVVPNGVDIGLFGKEFTKEAREKLENRLGKEPDGRFLITTSRLVEKNGVDTIIRALPHLSEHISLLILGSGPLEQELKDLARELDVEDRVQFIGLVPQQEIPWYLSVSDIFVRPSRSEGMGNSFIEAMAAGVPIIAAPVGGITDFLRDRDTGIACEVDNPESIARAVQTLLGDLSLQKKIVANARDLVERRYSWDTIARKMEAVLNAVIG